MTIASYIGLAFAALASIVTVAVTCRWPSMRD